MKRREFHGRSQTSEYRIWKLIKFRCFDPKSKDYPDYGGAGVRMCPEWCDSFMAFYTHIGARPSRLHTVDRIDTGGHYEPGNVRWATRSEQSRNRPATYVWHIRGREFGSAKDAALAFAVSTMTVYRWIGYPDTRNASSPPQRADCWREERYATR